MSPISANADEYKSKVGLDQLYVAQVTKDDSTGYTAGTPEIFAPAAEASQEPTSTFEIQYADNQPYDGLFAEGPTKLTVDVTGLPPAMLALILGRQFDATTGRLYDNGGIPPYVALGFRAMKSNGHYRYFWFLKGKFSSPKEEIATLGEKPEAKTTKLEFTALRTVYKFSLPNSVTDSVKRVVGDDDTSSFSATNWFAQVQTPASASVSALAVSSSDPAAGATGVVVSKVVTVTFNNALVAGAINNAMLLNGTSDAQIAGTNSLDATRKILTVGHTSSMPAATPIRIILAGVTDIYGQTLSQVISFTTA